MRRGVRGNFCNNFPPFQGKKQQNHEHKTHPGKYIENKEIKSPLQPESSRWSFFFLFDTPGSLPSRIHEMGETTSKKQCSIKHKKTHKKWANSKRSSIRPSSSHALSLRNLRPFLGLCVCSMYFFRFWECDAKKMAACSSPSDVGSDELRGRERWSRGGRHSSCSPLERGAEAARAQGRPAAARGGRSRRERAGEGKKTCRGLEGNETVRYYAP